MHHLFRFSTVGYHPQTSAAEVKPRPLRVTLGWGNKIVA